MAHEREVTGQHGAINLHRNEPPFGQVALNRQTRDDRDSQAIQHSGAD